MFNSNLIATLSLVVLLNYLNASVNNISNIINDMSVLIDDIKNRYISLKHDIFSPANSVITNFWLFTKFGRVEATDASAMLFPTDILVYYP